eukprot:6466768-Pyramimonas_sp.AAC.1
MHSSFVFRMCCGKNKCDTCLASIASRQRRDPDWAPEGALESLRENGYDMYWPGEIPEEAPQEGPLGPLTVVADERDPRPAEEQRSYPTFLDIRRCASRVLPGAAAGWRAARRS